jgi:hypothetical protein
MAGGALPMPQLLVTAALLQGCARIHMPHASVEVHQELFCANMHGAGPRGQPRARRYKRWIRMAS